MNFVQFQENSSRRKGYEDRNLFNALEITDEIMSMELNTVSSSFISFICDNANSNILTGQSQDNNNDNKTSLFSEEFASRRSEVHIGLHSSLHSLNTDWT